MCATPDQMVGDIYSLAACNEAGDRRLQAMMDEFGIDDLDGLSDFIIDTSRARDRRPPSRGCPTAPTATRCASTAIEAPVRHGRDA